MKCVYTIEKLVVYALILLVTVTNIVAQEVPVLPNEEAASGLSGKVVDIEGKPISGFTFIIQSMQFVNGFPQPFVELPHLFQEQPEDEKQLDVPRPATLVKTEADGTFKTTDIQPGYVEINAIPAAMLDAMKRFDPKNPNQAHQLPMEMMRFGRNKSEMQILSIRLNKITFFVTDEPGPFQGLTFGLKPGTTIEDVKITVKKLLKIRAQIVYADGTPLVKADVRLSMRYRGGEFGGGSGSHGTSCLTDAEGYFTEYREDQGYYTLSVKYKTFSGGAGPFLIKKDEHPENIVIRLDGNPVIAKRPTGDLKKLDEEKARRFINEVFVDENVRQPIARQREKIVWIINPANGHAYAKIFCQGWLDAQQKAIAEGAHLVSINDEEEQFWVQVMFRDPHFWIGLNDVEKEGVWAWDSGEPVTYTNWATRGMFPDHAPDTEKDYVVVTFHEGGWQAVSPKGPLWRIARTAIIEKDGLVSKIPEPVESEDD